MILASATELTAYIIDLYDEDPEAGSVTPSVLTMCWFLDHEISGDLIDDSWIS